MPRKRCDKGECLRFDLEWALRRIRECAIDGQSGSASYGLDRLNQIREIVDAKLGDVNGSED